MNEVLFSGWLFGTMVTITAWKLVGYVGTRRCSQGAGSCNLGGKDAIDHRFDLGVGLDEGEEEIFLGTHVLVHGSDADSRIIGDQVDVGSREAMGREGLAGSQDDPELLFLGKALEGRRPSLRSSLPA